MPRCDFITDMGHRTPAGSRAELGFTGGGPQWLVTELGVFDFDDDRPRPAARASSRTSSVADIQAATGFELRVAADLRTVRPPGTAELAALRAVDPLGVRRAEFSPAELRRTFTTGTGAPCGC